MSDQDSNDKETVGPLEQPVFGSSYFMAMTGYLLLTGCVGLLGFLAYMAYQAKAVEGIGPDQLIAVWIIQQYGYPLLILIGAGIVGYLGMKLIGASGERIPTVIPPQDYELLSDLIKQEKKDAIGLYVILSSLSGFTGTFQKIGFSGLPLATAILTLIFSALSFFQTEFLELAKLTLGAFIGSFVQKGTNAPKLPNIKDMS